MSDHQKRLYVKNMYLTPNWHERVDKMSDRQVHAIYIRETQKAGKSK